MAGASSYQTLSQACRAYGIPQERIGNPNETEFVEFVRHLAPDLLVSVACPYILKGPLLAIAPKGAINIHHAPLPRYKGMMPTFWQLFHGEKTVGLTIHYMVVRVDEGKALLQENQEIRPGESLDELIKRSKRRGAHCMAEVLRKIEAGKAEAVALEQTKGSYFSFPTAAEIREFRKRGLRAI
jgi:methionyl-tRNA formyltransferase